MAHGRNLTAAVFSVITLFSITACSEKTGFNGKYSASVGVGPMATLVVLMVEGEKAEIVIAKAFQNPGAPIPMIAEQSSDRIVFTKSNNKAFRMVFDHGADGGIRCIEECAGGPVDWERVKDNSNG